MGCPLLSRFHIVCTLSGHFESSDVLLLTIQWGFCLHLTKEECNSDLVKARTPTLALILFVFAVGYTFAENKVVVIPMGAEAAITPTTQWAIVKENGVVLTQSGGITAVRFATGGYYVTFPYDVTGHAIMAIQKTPWTSRGLSVSPCRAASQTLDGESIMCDAASNNKKTVAVLHHAGLALGVDTCDMV